MRSSVSLSSTSVVISFASKSIYLPLFLRWLPPIDNHWVFCYNKYMTKHYIKSTCEICGKEIEDYVKRRFCCFPCRNMGFSGSGNPAFKGDIATYRIDSGGRQYRYIRGGRKKVAEHRFVMEQHLGRKLERWEEVHHINGDTLNNQLTNLYVLDKKNHSRNHFLLFKKVQRLEQENKRLKAKLLSLSIKPLI